MAYDPLRHIAMFDSKSSNQYIYPSLKDLYHEPEKHPQWQHMLYYLFFPDTTHGKLFRRNLRIEAKLMLILCTHNVILRRGDKMEVKFQEVPVLYMLMHGSPMVPFRNIVPNCRLITALLKKYGAIGAEDKGSYKRFNPFDIQHLGSGWEYKESKRYHMLNTDGKRWRALKVDARPLRPGEADEPKTSDEEVSGNDDYREDTFTVDVEMGGDGPSSSVRGAGVQSGYVGSAFD
ncbi:hypothetical protein Hanom_Chr16g01441811 [Helianthus anomalus]